MGLLSKGTRGVIVRPPLILLYGVDGVGKSTFGASAPNPCFMGPEQGTDNLDVYRLPTPESWEEIIEGVKELTNDPHQPHSGSEDFGTLVVDTVDWLEPLVAQSVLKSYPKSKTLETAAGGFGKAYKEVDLKWLEFKQSINALRAKRNMNIILLGHSTVSKFLDPQLQETIDRYELKLYKSVSPMLREWVDAVLFVNHKTDTTEEKGTERKRFYGDGERVMFTERRPGWDAKNRFGLPLEMEFRWDALMEGIKNGRPDSPDAVRQRIEGLISILPDAKLVPIVRKTVVDSGDFTARLLEIEERLKVRLNDVPVPEEILEGPHDYTSGPVDEYEMEPE